MMVGLQGAGKTTNCAKLAGLMRKNYSMRPLLAACDVYRPAAIEQLKVVGAQLDLPVFEMGQGDPVKSLKPPSATRRTTATTWCFSTPPAGFTSMRS